MTETIKHRSYLFTDLLLNVFIKEQFKKSAQEKKSVEFSHLDISFSTIVLTQLKKHKL